MIDREKKISIKLTKTQFRDIVNACEYLGRHLIGQPNFKPLIMEDWIEEQEKLDVANTLLDIWKVWCYAYVGDKSESGACVHNYRPMKMGKYDFISLIEQDD